MRQSYLAEAMADAFNRLLRSTIATLINAIVIIAYVSPEHFVMFAISSGWRWEWS